MAYKRFQDAGEAYAEAIQLDLKKAGESSWKILRLKKHRTKQYSYRRIMKQSGERDCVVGVDV